jgi:transposase
MIKEYYLGIDVSKGYSDFIMLNERSEIVEDFFQIDDTVEGHQALKTVLKQHAEIEPNLLIYCGMESTGGYENNWYNFLQRLSNELNLKVVRLNPLVVKGISKASLNRTITDETSAINIATYLISYKGKINYQADDTDSSFKDARSIYAYQKMIVKQGAQLKNQIEKLIYKGTPELVSLCKRGIPLYLLRLLAKYPTAHEIRKAGLQKLMNIKGISPVRAQSIIAIVSKNQNQSSPDLSFALKNTAEEILHKMTKVEEIKQYLGKKYSKHPTVKLLTSIKGIGVDSAISILFEIEDIHRFPTVKKLVAYFGINPEFRQSGDGTYGNHMSKSGRKALRPVLYMCGLAAYNWDPMMKQLYKRYREKGKCHNFAIGVLMHKLLRIVYGVLKSGKPYDIAVDQENRDKSSEKQLGAEERTKQQIIKNREKKRRYLKAEDPLTAPISGRKARKLKELATSLSTESAIVQDHHQQVQK